MEIQQVGVADWQPVARSYRPARWLAAGCARVSHPLLDNHKLTSEPMDERFSSLDKLCMPETIRTSNISWLTIVELVVATSS